VHYPLTYYAFNTTNDSTLTRVLRGARARHATLQPSLLGRLLTRRTGTPDGLAAFARLGASPADRILDVGAGAGRLVRDLYAAGFRDVVGCDMYGTDAAGPPRLVRGRLDAVAGAWDVIMYHHCLEHIEDPASELARAALRLTPRGCVLVRVPLADSAAAEEYRDRWVQLDAPRHRVIPSAAGVRALASRAGLAVDTEWRDSSAFQFWGSELYRRDIALRAAANGPTGYFSAKQLADWEARAAALNTSARGDQGAFILRPRDTA
jgi:SAM-dependent methyltransferase